MTGETKKWPAITGHWLLFAALINEIKYISKTAFL